MDYNELKLGLFEKSKLWIERRKAESQRRQHYKDSGELLEIDYSKADKLKNDLLENKKIKKATKDAMRLYKMLYSNNDDEIFKNNFIENYLTKNGVKTKTLPEHSDHQKHSFMEQYPTKKSEEEIAYEHGNITPKIFYKINDVEYELPHDFYEYALNMAHQGKIIPLEEKEPENYIISDDEMNSYDKYHMLKKMLNITSNDFMGWLNEYLSQIENQKLKDRKNELSRKIKLSNNTIEKLYSMNDIDIANSILTQRIEDVLKFKQELFDDKEETR